MRKIIKFLRDIGGIDLQGLYLDKLPDLSDVHVDCTFLCGFNNLTNLVGAPKSVGGNFNCEDNKLTSLIGAPETVGGDFNCNGNDLTSLGGIPKKIGDDWREHSLGQFWISKELKDRFPEEYIRSLSDIKGRVVYC